MQFGIYLPNFGPYGDARVPADLAQDANAVRERILQVPPRGLWRVEEP